MRRYARKRDKVHAPIVRGLRACGVSVYETEGREGEPDILTGHHGNSVWMEFKTPEYAKAHKAHQARQDEWAKQWRGVPVLRIHSLEEALDALGLRAKGADTEVARFYPHR